MNVMRDRISGSGSRGVRAPDLPLPHPFSHVMALPFFCECEAVPTRTARVPPRTLSCTQHCANARPCTCPPAHTPRHTATHTPKLAVPCYLYPPLFRSHRSFSTSSHFSLPTVHGPLLPARGNAPGSTTAGGPFLPTKRAGGRGGVGGRMGGRVGGRERGTRRWSAPRSTHPVARRRCSRARSESRS